MYPKAKKPKNQNHSYPTPINPGNHGLKRISLKLSSKGIMMKTPVPIGNLNGALRTMERRPSGLFLTIWKTGVSNNEYWNKFHKNHRWPKAISFPKIGIQKKRLLHITPDRNPKVRPMGVVVSSPRINEPA